MSVRGTRLTPQHRDVLRSCGLSDPQIDRLEDPAQPWVRSVTHDEGCQSLGRKPTTTASYEGILFYFYGAEDQNVRDYLLRRDYPDLKLSKNGIVKPERKYMFPVGSPQRIWFPPDFKAAWLTDTRIPLIICEGIKKNLFAWTLPLPGTWATISIQGTWGYRGTVATATNAKGHRVKIKGVIPDFGLFQFQGRIVIIIYDSDVLSNVEVGRARNGLTRELFSRGAQVKWVDIKDANGNEFLNKVGFDDLATMPGYGPTYALALITKAINPQGAAALAANEHPYFRRDGALWRKVEAADGLADEQRVTHYDAVITADVSLDDGATIERSFDIAITAGGEISRCTVPAGDFQAPSWPTRFGGAAAVTAAHQWVHVPPAIQLLSHPPRITRYRHTGWRAIDGKNFYLDAEGAIGQDGRVTGIETALGGRLAQIRLEVAASDAELAEAAGELFSLLEVAVPRISYPLLGIVGRAVIEPAPDDLPWLTGGSGVFKSELTARIQQCWGRHFHRRFLPAGWNDTANSLERKLFLAKNALVVIDDFPVVSSARQAAELQQKADHFVRYIGNQIPRARLTRQLDQAPEYPPRGSALTSGEDVAKGVSLPTRIFAIDVGRGDVDFNRLVISQEQGAAGLFARAMGSYIRWFASELEARTKAYHARVAEIFQGLSARGHFRTPQAQASLQAGAEMLFEFARNKGAITDEEYHRRMEACAKALVEAGGPAKPPAADPAGRFLSFIRSALVSGRAHLVNDSGEAPDDACGCGWEWKGSDPYRHLEPRGERIGTVDDKFVFLNAAVALAVVRKLARETGDDFEVSARTLHKRLYDDKRLVTAGDPGETYLVRHTVAGLRNRGYLHLLASDVLGDDDRQASGQQARGSVAPQPPASLSELEDEDEPTIQ